MTNRQSNVIFYSIIFLIISAIIVHNVRPDIFADLTKSEQELSIKEAMKNGDHNKALASYKNLVSQYISENDENTLETAAMYEDIAKLYSLLGNTAEEINYYLKSLAIKNQLKKGDLYSLALTYSKLGSLAQEGEQYDQAQMYFEKSLSTRLGDLTESTEEEDDGMFISMQKSRHRYLRLNHQDTITLFKQLGKIHQLKKEQLKALEYYDKALQSSINTFGDDDIKTIEIITLIKKLSA